MVKGGKILTEVQYLLDDPSYKRYVEINRAYRDVAKNTAWNWLRGSSETLLKFESTVSSYFIDSSNIRRITGIWVKGGDDQRYRLLEEVPLELFETKVVESIDQNGTSSNARPMFYKLEGGPQPKVTLTPIPDQAYTVRVDYIESVEEISQDTDVNLPHDYFDLVAMLAAGYILERVADPERKQLGDRYMMRATQGLSDMVKDSHANRTGGITTIARKWLR